jgi:hypothetical protein
MKTPNFYYNLPSQILLRVHRCHFNVHTYIPIPKTAKLV